ncbi:MAG: response regulator [Anaerolineaceae bacterium]|nr:response regulator [Anaerolineaceae bacterium]
MNEKVESTILVVEEDIPSIRQLTQILKDHGYNVLASSSGLSALKTVQNYLPDLILLNITILEKEGIGFHNILRRGEKTRDVPVIFLLPVESLQSKFKVFAFGGADFISKPFQTQEVLERIGAHLTLRKLKHQVKESFNTLEKTSQSLANIISDLEGKISAEMEKNISEYDMIQIITNIKNQIIESHKIIDKGLADSGIGKKK